MVINVCSAARSLLTTHHQLEVPHGQEPFAAKSKFSSCYRAEVDTRSGRGAVSSRDSRWHHLVYHDSGRPVSPGCRGSTDWLRGHRSGRDYSTGQQPGREVVWV